MLNNRPKNWINTKDNECNVLSLKEKQLAKFSEPDQILIRGESDGRVGSKADSITQDRKNLDFLPEGYELDTFMTHRNNEEVSINNNGEKGVF